MKDKTSEFNGKKTPKTESLEHASPFVSTDQQSDMETQQSIFEIQRLYVKGLTYAAPSTPIVFQEDWKPALDMQIQTNSTALPNDLHEVVCKITINGKSNDKPAFTIELEQAGIFLIKNFVSDQFNAVIGQACPNILFPYARQVITNMAVLGTFPPIYLAPINFDALYAEHVKKLAEQEPASV